MILAALLLQAAAPQTALDAERAFAAAAQARGQWTAFREYAAEDAVLFVPQPVKAQDWLKDRKDPPKSVEWWPTESWVSCDEAFAVNTGGWKRPDGTVGFFTTVWRKEADGSWRWIVDGGDALKTPRVPVDRPHVRQARCDGKAKPYLNIRSTKSAVAEENARSRDYSLAWGWMIEPDGERHFWVSFWNGRDWKDVINDEISAPKP